MNKECQDAFESLKNSMLSTEILLADFNAPFYLIIDASKVGAGAILTQDFGGILRPVSYGS